MQETIMSGIIVQFAEEKARRLSLRSKTNVATVNRLLGRKDTIYDVIMDRIETYEKGNKE
jgi:hypothetical protein